MQVKPKMALGEGEQAESESGAKDGRSCHTELTTLSELRRGQQSRALGLFLWNYFDLSISR